MKTFELLISAQHVNLSRLEPEEGVNSRNICYFFKLECYVCKEISKEVTLHIGDNPMHFKCKACGRKGTVELLPNHGRPLLFGVNNTWAPLTPLVRFVTTVFKPRDYCFNEGWQGTGKNGENAELNLLNTPAQAKAGELEVMVTDMKHEFNLVRS